MIEEYFAANPHLQQYYEKFTQESGKAPVFQESLNGVKDDGFVDIIYKTGSGFIHVYGIRGNRHYVAIEPELTTMEEGKMKKLLLLVLEKGTTEAVADDETSLKNTIMKLVDKCTKANETFFETSEQKCRILVTPEEKQRITYFVLRNIIGNSILQPLIDDPYIEDIHCIGTNLINITHKIFGMVESNIKFKDDGALVNYLRSLCDRVGKPVSESRPIVDATMPDGSRINIVFSDAVSLRGASFTIRKFQETPISIVQLIKWGTFSSTQAAYLWMAVENGMSVFFCGETAAGKTTALNAIAGFVPPSDKLFSVEDTAEFQARHKNWQQTLTKNNSVTMFDLLKTALRSRPNYIIVGEIRDREGAVAFQAMQTGHAVMATFHASSLKVMIQRLVGDPINVPVRFIDNLKLSVFMAAVSVKGRVVRRCTSIDEIEAYYAEENGTVNRNAFAWDPVDDRHRFNGLNTSYILEKIGGRTGRDQKALYAELNQRAKILDTMVARNILDYDSVEDVIFQYYLRGTAGLPFQLG